MDYYLIDYENTGENGLRGITDLNEDTCTVIFYSENADKISFDMHQKLRECRTVIEYRKISTGKKNALDFQLSTYLGYLLAKCEEDRFFIVSKDNGYRVVIDFWKNREVRQIDAIAFSMPKKPVQAPQASDVSVQEEKQPKPEAVQESVEAEQQKTEIVQDRAEAVQAGAETVPVEAETAQQEPEPVRKSCRTHRSRRRRKTEPAAEPAAASVKAIPSGEGEALPISGEALQGAGDASQEPGEISREPEEASGKTGEVSQGAGEISQNPDKTPQEEQSQPALSVPLTGKDLKEQVALVIVGEEEQAAICRFITKYKTKQGVNNALVKLYGSEKAGELYKKIKPLIKDKKGK